MYEYLITRLETQVKNIRANKKGRREAFVLPSSPIQRTFPSSSEPKSNQDLDPRTTSRPLAPKYEFSLVLPYIFTTNHAGEMRLGSRDGSCAGCVDAVEVVS